MRATVVRVEEINREEINNKLINPVKHQPQKMMITQWAKIITQNYKDHSMLNSESQPAKR
jgi:hypothetical protein